MNYILSIETSCDETSAAVVCDSQDVNQRILSNTILSQNHTLYGGVIPEIASRSHLESLSSIILN